MYPSDPLNRPATPEPNAKRTLQRTVSCASLDTICPPKRNKGIRRSINEISENLMKRKHSRDATKNPTRDKATLKAKAINDTKKATQDGPGKIFNGVFFREDTPSIALDGELKPVDEPSPSEDEEAWEDCLNPWPIERPKVTADGRIIFQPRQTSKVGIKDIQLSIQPHESDVTFWDGLQVSHHLYKCRLFLKCTAYPYDSVLLPHIRLVEMRCKTSPILGSRYASPVLQTIYKGASLNKFVNGKLDIKLADGIHVDEVWRTSRKEDGTWGWYRDACIPLPSRLFEKIDYREFKLISRVWLGHEYLECGFTFGISMLLQEVEMK